MYICTIGDKESTSMTLKHLHMFVRTVIAAAMIAAVSCTPDWKDEMTPVTSGSQVSGNSDRDINTDTRKVLLLYSAGFNSISSYLKEDIEDLSSGWLPKKRKADDVILVYSHQPKAMGQYSEKTSPVLFRMYAESDGTVVRDTLVTYEPGTVSASAGQMNKVLTYVRDNFPAVGYGMIFSSHATGYLPSGFYSKPDSYTFKEDMMYRQGARERWPLSPVPYIEHEQDPSLPAVKSIGQDIDGVNSYEMDIRDFAEAIPMKMDYILFDACLMGGIEVAYELAGKCDKIGFSQAEVLAEGFNYSTLASHLLGNKSESDPYSVCKDYFEQYDIQTGVNRSATISLIDCSQLDQLAETCQDLFEKYSDGMSDIDHRSVQGFFRSSRHWFYDMESIMANAGATEEDMDSLKEAIGKCILYKGATPSFMGEFTIRTFSGFSMYLPCYGHNELNKYYRTLKWNKATGLVR